MKPLLRHKILVFALLTALLTDIGLLVVLWPRGFAADFAVYWQATNSSVPYAPSATPFANPPTVLLWLQPLRILPLWLAYSLFTLGGLGAYVWTGGKLYGRGAIALGVLSPAVALGAIPGQLAIIVAALVFLAFSSPPFMTAVFLAIAATLKPQMVLLAPVTIFAANGMKGLFVFAATILALVLAATLSFGSDVWLDWLLGMQTMVRVAAERGMPCCLQFRRSVSSDR